MYNPDHSLWKKFTFPIISGHRVSSVKYPSKHLFNTDDKVEVIVSYYKNGYPPHCQLEIVNETGTSVQTIDNGMDMAQVFNSESGQGAKAIVFSAPGLGGWHTGVDIYTLAGPYTGGLKAPVAGRPVADVQILPNPVDHIATMRYVLAPGQTGGVINVFDAAGRAVRTIPVSGNFGSVPLDVSGWAPGIYSYSTGGAAETFIVK